MRDQRAQVDIMSPAEARRGLAGAHWVAPDDVALLREPGDGSPWLVVAQAPARSLYPPGVRGPYEVQAGAVGHGLEWVATVELVTYPQGRRRRLLLLAFDLGTHQDDLRLFVGGVSTRGRGMLCLTALPLADVMGDPHALATAPGLAISLEPATLTGVGEAVAVLQLLSPAAPSAGP